MRFNLRSLFLFLTALAVAYFIACNFLLNSLLITWKHTRALFDIQSVQRIAQQLHNEKDKTGFSNAQNELFTLVSETPDPWRNSYQVLNFSDNNEQLEIEVYSFGEDGLTLSSGDDPDDINTWDPESVSFYDRRVRWHWEKQRIWQTIFSVPLLLCLAWIIKKIYVRIRQITMC